MDDLYFDYLRERTEKEVWGEKDKGFVIFQISGEELYIQDIYVTPKHRKTGFLREMEKKLEEYAIAQGCKFATGSVQPSTKGSTESLLYCLNVGYKLWEAHNDWIILRKDLIKE